MILNNIFVSLLILYLCIDFTFFINFLNIFKLISIDYIYMIKYSIIAIVFVVIKTGHKFIFMFISLVYQ